MRKAEADAINRQRRAAPLEQSEYLAIRAVVDQHRARLVYRLHVVRWLNLWKDNWRRLSDDFLQQAPGTAAWHDFGVRCMDHLRALAWLRHEETVHPGQPDRMNLEAIAIGRPRDLGRAIGLLIILHLRGSEDAAKRGAHLLNEVLRTELPYPQPPWSRSALEQLAKAMGLAQSLVEDAYDEEIVAGLVPDPFIEIVMPEPGEILEVVCAVYVLGQPRAQPDPVFDLSVARLRTAAEFLHAIGDKDVDHIQAGHGGPPALPYLRHAARDAIRIGRRLDPAFGQPRFPPNLWDHIVPGERQRIPPPTRDLPIPLDDPDDAPRPARRRRR